MSGRRRVAIAIRAENLRIGPRAGEAGVQIEATLRDVIYRGTNVDHVLEMEDGQHLVVTSTRREVLGSGQKVSVGLDPENVVLLED